MLLECEQFRKDIEKHVEQLLIYFFHPVGNVFPSLYSASLLKKQAEKQN